MPRRLLLPLTFAAIIALGVSRPAALHLSFADAADPNPRRVEIGAQILGLGLGLVLSWTQHVPVSQ